MGIISGLAIYFIIWWTALFVILPIGNQSQHESGERALGTADSAPINARMGFKFMLTTALATVVFVVFYVVTQVFGLGPDDFPHMIPGT
ncbi:DUF1467 family protein [Aurantimonas sp. 22II-16-19i]|uniref:DUF1467 family protein n=1 Tax=Aurantimonas sp. 22II-16-19i TaxID=1317114 RepID=UPI0009F7D514|nr:DUF1467 family protein [Aurantimonas sp. 22II-16-19i]ORE99172.1 hypothetical protein ATO4_02360 [Aurantimonas sp. 22II-16-19i]